MLNVWAPSGTDPGDAKPVMVWVHRGAYIFGAASQPLYDGKALAESGDLVVVTVNYRLGAFRFLDLSSFSTPRRRFDAHLGLRSGARLLGRTRPGRPPHPVSLIIGTNKHEAALFCLMKSPLMPITPPAIRAMFAEIAAEQPGLTLPTEAQIGSA